MPLFDGSILLSFWESGSQAIHEVVFHWGMVSGQYVACSTPVSQRERSWQLSLFHPAKKIYQKCPLLIFSSPQGRCQAMLNISSWMQAKLSLLCFTQLWGKMLQKCSRLLHHQWKVFFFYSAVLREFSSKGVCYFSASLHWGVSYPLWQKKFFTETHWTELFEKEQSRKVSATTSVENACCHLNKHMVYICLLRGIIFFYTEHFSESYLIKFQTLRVKNIEIGWIPACGLVGFELWYWLVRDRVCFFAFGFGAKVYLFHWPFLTILVLFQGVLLWLKFQDQSLFLSLDLFSGPGCLSLLACYTTHKDS